MNIALCTDDRYANHCAICITSILENNKLEDCHIYVMTEGLLDENLKKFHYLEKYYKKPVEVKVIDGKIFEGLQVTGRLPRSMYFRFMLPEIINDSSLLYLDCDIIVRHSLRDLFHIDLTNYACGVVEDQCGDDVRMHNRINMFSRYFNSGVLLMNLDYWRKYDIAKKLIDYIANAGWLMCPDQDALNVVLEGKVLFLGYEYNFQEGFYNELIWLRADKWDKVEEAKKDPIVVHYTSGEKPWHKFCTHPLAGEYDKYMMLHSVLFEKKELCHSRRFYFVERIVRNMRLIYQSFRRRNGMIVNQI